MNQRITIGSSSFQESTGFQGHHQTERNKLAESKKNINQEP